MSTPSESFIRMTSESDLSSSHQVIQSGIETVHQKASIDRTFIIIVRHCSCLVCVSLKLVRSLYIKTTISDPDEIYTIDESFVRDTIQTVIDILWDDRIRKLLPEELNTTFQAQHRSRSRSFSNLNGGDRDCSRRRSTSRRRSHPGQSLVATSAAGPHTGLLLHVTD